MATWPSKPYGWFSIEKSPSHSGDFQSNSYPGGTITQVGGGTNVQGVGDSNSYLDSLLSVVNIEASTDSYSFSSSETVPDSSADSRSDTDFRASYALGASSESESGDMFGLDVTPPEPPKITGWNSNSVTVAGAVTPVTATIPAHSPGDLILVWAGSGSANTPVPTPPVVPAAAGTVPAFKILARNAGSANSVGVSGAGSSTATRSQTVAWARATRSDHTLGNWGTSDLIFGVNDIAVAVIKNGSDPFCTEQGALSGTQVAQTSLVGLIAPSALIEKPDGKSLVIHTAFIEGVCAPPSVKFNTRWSAAPAGYGGTGPDGSINEYTGAVAPTRSALFRAIAKSKVSDKPELPITVGFQGTGVSAYQVAARMTTIEVPSIDLFNEQHVGFDQPMLETKVPIPMWANTIGAAAIGGGAGGGSGSGIGALGLIGLPAGGGYGGVWDFGVFTRDELLAAAVGGPITLSDVDELYAMVAVGSGGRGGPQNGIVGAGPSGGVGAGQGQPGGNSTVKFFAKKKNGSTVQLSRTITGTGGRIADHAIQPGGAATGGNYNNGRDCLIAGRPWQGASQSGIDKPGNRPGGGGSGGSASTIPLFPGYEGQSGGAGMSVLYFADIKPASPLAASFQLDDIGETVTVIAETIEEEASG